MTDFVHQEFVSTAFAFRNEMVLVYARAQDQNPAAKRTIRLCLPFVRAIVSLCDISNFPLAYHLRVLRLLIANIRPSWPRAGKVWDRDSILYSECESCCL